MNMSDNETKLQLIEVVGAIKNLTNELRHYTENQERHREETEKRFDKQEERNERRFEKIEAKQEAVESEISEVKEKSATESAMLKAIQDSNTANKRLAHTVIAGIIITAIIGGLAFKLSGG